MFLNYPFSSAIENNAPLFLIINTILRHALSHVLCAYIVRAFSFIPIARDDDVTIVRAVQSEAFFLQIAFEAQSPTTFDCQPNSREYQGFPLVFDRQIRRRSFPLFLSLRFLLLMFSLFRCLSGGIARCRLVKP